MVIEAQPSSRSPEKVEIIPEELKKVPLDELEDYLAKQIDRIFDKFKQQSRFVGRGIPGSNRRVEFLSELNEIEKQAIGSGRIIVKSIQKATNENHIKLVVHNFLVTQENLIQDFVEKWHNLKASDDAEPSSQKTG